MNTFELLEYDREHVWHPYTSTIDPLPCYLVESAEGTQIKLVTGETLIDGMSSWWCAIFGYNNVDLNKAAMEQLGKMSHVMFGGLTNEPAVKLCKALIDITAPNLQHCFLADSGSVAVEVSLKMAFQYCDSKCNGVDNRKKKFLTFRHGYHGDTFGAISVCDPHNSMHSLYAGFVRENIFVDPPQCKPTEEWDDGYMQQFKEAIETHHEDVIAVILEPIVQGAGGMKIYHPEYLKTVRKLCDKYDVLLILDEIATGFGRTGKLFAYEHAGIEPDILCVGKALTNGYVTLSAVLCSKDVANTVCSGRAGTFMHGPTFMGNPLACSIASKNLELIGAGGWKQQVASIEATLNECLMPVKDVDIVADVRILGAIGVVELHATVDMKWFQQQFVKRGVWVRPFGKLVYVMPPYIISEAELRYLINSIIEVVTEFGDLKKREEEEEEEEEE